jgi:hypothetical protein
MRVFINSKPVEVPAGTDVRGAIRAHDPELEARVGSGTAYVTDARAIELPPGAGLTEGAILRVVVRAQRGSRDDDADA